MTPGGEPSFVVFDLDGTLIDGYAAIGDALGFAMRRLGVPELSPERVRAMVGRGLETLLEDAVGAERADEGVRLFRERYPEVAVEKSHLLPGVGSVLEILAGRGHPMAVASNKPARFSRMILEAKGIGGRFRAVGGPDAETPPKPDPAMLRMLMSGAGRAAQDTLVVGDMEVDYEFARAAGCRVALIPGGSRSRKDLAALEADAHLDRIADLPEWIARA